MTIINEISMMNAVNSVFEWVGLQNCQYRWITTVEIKKEHHYLLWDTVRTPHILLVDIKLRAQKNGVDIEYFFDKPPKHKPKFDDVIFLVLSDIEWAYRKNLI